MNARRASGVLLRALRLRLALTRSVAVGAALAVIAACGITTGPSGAGAAGDGGGEAPSGEAGPGGAPRTDGGDDAGAAASDGGPAVDAATPGCDCTPVWVALGELYPSDVAVDATYVYWTAGPQGNGGRVIRRAPVGGGAAETLVSNQVAVARIAVRGEFLYWVNDAGSFDTSAVGEIWRRPTSGGPASQVSTVTDSTGLATVRAFAVDGANVYWSITEPRGSSGETDAALFQAPVGGGAPVRLASLPGVVVSDLAVDGTHVYWVSYGLPTPPAVSRMRLDGGEVTPVVPSGPRVSVAFALEGDEVYWTEHPGDQVVPAASARAALLRMPLAGGPRVELASARATSVSLALHGGAVYWGRWGGASGGGSDTLADGALLRTTRAGVTAKVLEGMDPVRIAASDTAVCWTAARWITFGGLGDVICLLG